MRKPSPRKGKPVRYPVGLKIPAGGSPEADRMVDGGKDLRVWQKAAFKQLYQNLMRIVIGPTGSGKSILIAALAIKDLQDERAQKIIVGVPQSIIASSFDGGLKIKMPGGAVVRWEPGHRLIETTDVVARLRDFLTTPMAVAKVNSARILVCSHAALVAYHAKYHGPDTAKLGLDPNDWSDYNKVAVSIDEAHHSRSPGEDEGDADDAADDADDEATNRLGKFVSDWCARKPGPLTLTTATWFRTDRIAIIPPDQYNDFARYTHSVADYLASLQHLKEIEIRFLPGTPEMCIKRIQREDARANTLVYIRPTAPGRDKFEELHALRKRLRLSKANIVDLVDPKGRDQRKEALIRSVKAGEYDLKLNGTRKKNWLFALMLGREGFDLPALQRIVVIGPRASMQVITQMLGRLLRDHPGKEKVQFNIVLPFTNDDMRNGGLIQAYVKVMLASLALGALLHPPKFTCEEDRETHARVTVNGPDALRDMLVTIRGSLSDDVVKDSDALVDGLIKNGDIDLTEGCTVESMRRVLLAILRRQAEAVMLTGLPDPTMVRDDFVGVRAYVMSFGHRDLTNYARMVGQYVPFTMESADAAIHAWFAQT